MMTDTADRRRIICSISLSALIWLILVLFAAFIPLALSKPEEQVFTTVSITLAPPGASVPAGDAGSSAADAPTEEGGLSGAAALGAASPEEVPAPAPPAAETKTPPAPAPSVQKTEPSAPAPKPAAPKTPPVQKPESKPAESTKVPSAVKIENEKIPEEQKLAPDLTGGNFDGINRNSGSAPPAKKPPAEWPDDSVFEYSSENTLAVTPPSASSPNTDPPPVFNGKAGDSAGILNGPVKASGSGGKGSGGEDASRETEEALRGIVKSYTGTGGKGSGLSYESGLNASSSQTGGTGGASLAAVGADGVKRRLLDPATPVITLSAESEKLIDASTIVTIKLRVLEDGTVPMGSIEFTPSGLLPLKVKEEIQVIISRWRFDPGKNDGQASFQYSIKKE